MDRMMVTAGSLTESRKAIDWCARDARLVTTVGCHPTRAGEFDQHEGGPEAYLEGLMQLAKEGAASGKVVAIGECGLGTWH